ncbi:MAG TPA: DsrE family protein [Noviherbaspirillum sp.]|uniref:DsrE family protein n=1 Tax=Noviherbaspirillum sp. TaxID=1926288 RepID=UPI002B47C091|nr:DsrE family protein [Noviherbaspirillum sp.]HJV85316.1 DsrE family protein [Noviherbaspirillum sp.]
MKTLRNAFTVLFLAWLTLATATAAQNEEKVVYHLNDATVAMAALNNIRNHLNASPKAKIVVVAHGAGIDFLLDGAKDKNGNPYDAVVQELVNRNVQFRVCNNTLQARKIDKSRVIPEATVVPSGVAEIARLQSQEGFVYLKP